MIDCKEIFDVNKQVYPDIDVSSKEENGVCIIRFTPKKA